MTPPPVREPCVDLRVSGRSEVDAAAPGQRFTVDLQIENDGTQTATGIQLSGAQAEVTPGTIGPGEAAVGRVVARAGRVGSQLLTITATSAGGDADPETNALTLGVIVLDCTRVGTSGNDVLVGTPRNDKLCGRPGADRLEGRRGNDRLDGGSGNDTILGGPGRDRIDGGGGVDVIVARDGQRDTIDCGTERDTVLADRLDLIVRGARCERVVRR